MSGIQVAVAEARRRLGAVGEGLDDEEVLATLQRLHAIAAIVVELALEELSPAP